MHAVHFILFVVACRLVLAVLQFVGSQSVAACVSASGPCGARLALHLLQNYCKDLIGSADHLIDIHHLLPTGAWRSRKERRDYIYMNLPSLCQGQTLRLGLLCWNWCDRTTEHSTGCALGALEQKCWSKTH